MSLPAQQIIASPYLAGNPTAPTPNVGDNSEAVATTQFVQQTVTGTLSETDIVNTFNGRDGAVSLTSGDVTSAIGFTPVQQGTGIGQLSNMVKIGWSGTQVLCTVDSTDLGQFLLAADLNNLVTDINSNVSNLQNQINSIHSGGGFWTTSNFNPLNVNGIGYVVFIVVNGNSSYSQPEGTVMALPGRPGSWLSCSASAPIAAAADYWGIWTRIA